MDRGLNSNIDVKRPFFESAQTRWRNALNAENLYHKYVNFLELSNTVNKRFQEGTFLTADLIDSSNIKDTLNQRWMVFNLACDIRLHTLLSVKLMESLFSFGIPRVLDDYDTPGPWAVIMTALLIEKDPKFRDVWKQMLAILEDYTIRPSDSTFLGLCFQKNHLLRAEQLISTDQYNQARQLVQLAVAVHMLAYSDKPCQFPANSLSSSWFNHRFLRGFRRNRARLLGLHDAKAGVKQWPEWLVWNNTETCPRSLSWMAAEWYVATIRCRSEKMRRSLSGTMLMPEKTSESDDLDTLLKLPDQFKNLCVLTPQGDKIASWVIKEIGFIMENRVGQMKPNGFVGQTTRTTIGRRRRQTIGE